jgi:hypothetical protein
LGQNGYIRSSLLSIVHAYNHIDLRILLIISARELHGKTYSKSQVSSVFALLLSAEEFLPGKSVNITSYKEYLYTAIVFERFEPTEAAKHIYRELKYNDNCPLDDLDFHLGELAKKLIDSLPCKKLLSLLRKYLLCLRGADTSRAYMHVYIFLERIPDWYERPEFFDCLRLFPGGLQSLYCDMAFSMSTEQHYLWLSSSAQSLFEPEPDAPVPTYLDTAGRIVLRSILLYHNDVVTPEQREFFISLAAYNYDDQLRKVAENLRIE